MKDLRKYATEDRPCSWCHEEIVNEVYVLAINKTYCRTKCMVSDIQWARQFVQEEHEEIQLNNELALIKTDKLFV